MWAALLAGKVAYISTDHAPWQRERKIYKGDIFALGAGLTGMQSFAPVMFTLLEERGLPLTMMAKYCSAEPARYHGLSPKKGSIAVGADADLCVIERGDFTFDQATIIDRPEFQHSAYHGRALRGRVAATYLRGRCVWNGATVLAVPGQGRFVPRQNAAPVALPPATT